MRRFYMYPILFMIVLFLLAGLPGVMPTVDAGKNQYALQPHPATSATRIVGQMLTKQVVDMSKVPAASITQGVPGSGAGINSGASFTTAQRDAASLRAAPVDTHPHRPSPASQSAPPHTPSLATSFRGEYETICPLKVCPPLDPAPDMALGVSPNWVLQGVNRWFAVYNQAGAIQSGWPKMFQTFFGVPDPAGCTSIPNLFNPRAFYDANDQHFWAAALNDDHPLGRCTSTYSKIWIAVSQTSNPNGLWNVYSFDLMLGTQNFGDFTQFGYDQQAVYFSADMWTQPSGSGTFEYENTFGLRKAAMEAGQNVTPYGFSHFTSGGVQMNGIQPVEAEAFAGAGPAAGLFVSPFDYNFGGGFCKSGCSGLVVWAIANPGKPSESLSSITVPTSRYVEAPNADQPGCTRCLFTLDPGINSTPSWRNGQISFGLVTAVNNGTQLVSGIFWGQINVSLNANGVLAGASMHQSGYFSFSGDTSALTPALMTDVNGNLVMVFTESGSTIAPGAYYVEKPAGTPLGSFPDSGRALIQGQAAAASPRWGDYTAVSVEGVGAQGVWIASEYEITTQFWSTSIGAVHTG